MEQVEDLLSGSRLVTITGSGGVGKTRLAIQVARSLMPQFRDGVCWVGLATLVAAGPFDHEGGAEDRRPPKQRAATAPLAGETQLPGEDLVIQAAAKALRVPESPGLPLLDELVEHLHGRQLLLVLDNCEHLIAACAALVERLLGECRKLVVLATSREPLGLPGEKAWPLPSLSLPEREPSVEFSRFAQSEAVRLFVERTADALPGYKPVELDAPAIAQICLRLDGMPLAIELAAARMNLLSANEIAGRLDDRFSLLTAGRRTALPQHQTLRAAIEWSTDLLTEPEQVLFRRLSVFAGSFTLEAAEAVCTGDAVEPDETLTLLGRLVDKSLLQVDPTPQHMGLATRYRYLDTIRSFGRLKLDEAGETSSMLDRHAAYYVRLAETIEPKLLLQDQAIWYKLLQTETDNIRAAIEWCAERGQAESALRLVGAMLWFWWWWHGSVREGLVFVLQALALPSGSQFKQYRARALNTAGYLQWALHDVGAARQNIEEALAIFRELDDETGLSWSLQLFGLVLTAEGEYDLADEVMEEGVAIARNLGNMGTSSFTLAFRGDIALKQGDIAKAKMVYEENADLLREIGNRLLQAYAVRRLGYLALERNDVVQAWRYFRESLVLNQEGGDKLGVAACLTSMAVMSLHLDKPLLAARLLGAVESRLEVLNIHLLELDRTELARVRSETLNILDEETFTASFIQGWELSEDEAIQLVEEAFWG
jgi:predicted ATPase